MVAYHFETTFSLDNQTALTDWIQFFITEKGNELGELNYIFCDDEYLLALNKKYLQHSTFTDIISFDYTKGIVVSGDIYISVERVKENAEAFNVSFTNELHRVMIHGVLHYLGFKDKTNDEKELMRHEENQALLLLKC